MSGPKVVHIITREEQIQRAERLLERLDCAIGQWLNKRMQLTGDIESDLEKFQQQRENLQTLLENDQFSTLEQAMPLVIASLEVNIADHQEQAITEQVRIHRRNRQLKKNAQVLCQQLRHKNISIPVQLAEQLEAITKGLFDANSNSVLQQGFLLLQPVITPQILSAEQQRLLNKMSPSSALTSFEQWQNSQGDDSDPARQKLERFISELNIIDRQQAQAYSMRLNLLDSETDPSQYQLLLDSLNLDLANEIRYSKKRQSLMERLEQLVTEIQAQQVRILPETQANLKQLHQTKLVELEQLIAQCEMQLNQHVSEENARSRRQAILCGLTKLGYEVREGMATAWQQNGNIIINNPMVPGYGIEIGGKAANARLQIRPVRLTSVEDHSRDIDAETLWCSDFNRLSQWMTEQGCRLELERGTPVGQIAVKYTANNMYNDASFDKQLQHSLIVPEQ